MCRTGLSARSIRQLLQPRQLQPHDGIAKARYDDPFFSRIGNPLFDLDLLQRAEIHRGQLRIETRRVSANARLGREGLFAGRIPPAIPQLHQRFGIGGRSKFFNGDFFQLGIRSFRKHCQPTGPVAEVETLIAPDRRVRPRVIGRSGELLDLRGGVIVRVAHDVDFLLTTADNRQ